MKIGVKKGQVSVFVIIGIILIAIAGGFIYFNKGDDSYFDNSEIRPRVNNIQTSIFECIDETGKDALDLIGVQGGYYSVSEEYFDLGWAFIPYYYKDGNVLMPSNNKVQDSLANYVDDMLVTCLLEIDEPGFNINFEDSETSVIINKESVSFDVNLAIIIKREGNRIKIDLKEHQTTLDSKLYEILEIARYIADSDRENPDMLCTSCIIEMIEGKGLFVDMIDFGDETTTLFVISDDLEEPYIFEFLNKHEDIGGGVRN